MTIHELVAKRDFEGIRKHSESGENLDRCYPDADECALASAAAVGDFEIVSQLLGFGAKTNNAESIVQPLAAAIGGGSLEVVRSLLANGAELNAIDEDGTTPLMLAAVTGNEDLVQLLVECGADARAKDRRGITALEMAAQRGHLTVCKILSPLVTPKDREKGRINLEIHAQGGASKLVNALIMAATKGDFTTVQSLIADGLSADSINEDGQSALMRAANKNHKMIVDWLLERGANVSRIDIYGESPVSYAAMGCHPEMFDFLIPLSDQKLSKRAHKIRENQIAVGNWPKS